MLMADIEQESWTANVLSTLSLTFDFEVLLCTRREDFDELFTGFGKESITVLFPPFMDGWSVDIISAFSWSVTSLMWSLGLQFIRATMFIFLNACSLFPLMMRYLGDEGIS